MKENQKESLWEYSYRLETENIHVPESLKDKTLEAMRQAMEEEPKRHRKKNWAAAGILAAAACLCLVLLGNYTGLLGGTGDEIHVAKVAEQAGQWDLEMNLGQAGSSEEEEEARDGISVQEVPSAKFLPQGLWEADTSYVEGREVKIGRDPDQSCWYAAWESEDVYYFAEGEDMSQEEFVEELKKIWKSP